MTIDGIEPVTQIRAGMNLAGVARSLWKQLLRLKPTHARSLRLRENLPLGDRRFVAVVEYEEMRFLIGGTSGSLVLLAELGTKAAEERSPRDNSAPTAGQKVQP